MSDLTQEEYIKNRGMTCPVCRHGNIELQHSDYDGSDFVETVMCIECGSEWMDVLKLSEYILTSRKGVPIHEAESAQVLPEVQPPRPEEEGN